MDCLSVQMETVKKCSHCLSTSHCVYDINVSDTNPLCILFILVKIQSSVNRVFYRGKAVLIPKHSKQICIYIITAYNALIDPFFFL